MANKKLVEWGCLARHKGGSRLAGLRESPLSGGRHCLEMMGEMKTCSGKDISTDYSRSRARFSDKSLVVVMSVMHWRQVFKFIFRWLIEDYNWIPLK
jgi:hypothetical protein|tara:strand:- start:96 stop:386 length:291 start_codon:yes stop_codon:yes gene_type:complete